MPQFGTLTDSRDGHVYRTVLMPDGKWWLAENLAWAGAGVERPEIPVAKHGRLYAHADIVAGCAIPGCHVPDGIEWNALRDAPGVTASALKANDPLWSTPGTNELGFNGIPSGQCWFNGVAWLFDQPGNGWFCNSDAPYSWQPLWKMVLLAGGFDTSTFSGTSTDYFSIRLIIDSGNIPDTCATPVATPEAGTYTSAQSVALTSATPGASIYYTLDGSEPTLTSALGIKPTNLGTKVVSNTGLLVKSESLMFVTGLGQAITRSVDRGSTWSYVAEPTASWYRDGFVTRDGSLIYGFSGGQLKISHDDAVTWEVLTGSPSRDAGSFWRDVDDGSIRHGGWSSASIYKSLDEGLTWSIVPGANAGRQCCQAHDGTLYEGRRGFPIYKSTDKGVTWTPIAGSPTKNWLEGSTVSADGSIWQIAEDEYLYKSSDNGVTWVAQTQYGARGWYAGDTSPNGTTYFTTWSGDTFLEIGYVALGSSTLYTAPLAIAETKTVKAISIAGTNNSTVTSATYTIEVVAPVTYNPPGGTYQGVQLVVLKSPQSLPIYYTLDGTDPTISSPLYVGPIPVYQDTQVKAAAFYGSIPSDTVTASYTITNGILKRIPSYRDRVLPYLLEQYKGDNT